MSRDDENVVGESSVKENGWAVFSVFKKTDSKNHPASPKRLSSLTKLLYFLVPMLLIATFYQYSSVLGSTFLNLTLRSNINLENGLIGHWTFDGPDVTDKVYDMSGEGNHGGLYGGATTSAKASGRVGQGLSFDGIDDRILLPSVPSLKPDQWTISVWAYALSGSGTYRGIFFPSYSDGYNSGFLLLISNEGRAAIRYGNGTAPVGSIFSNESILGQWHHIIGTFDGTNMVLYIDGVIEDTTDASTFAYGVSPVQSQIGDGNGTDSFDGKLDDVRFYNRALSVKEVEALYKQGEGSKVSVTPPTTPALETGLVGHWTFDGPDVTDKVYDMSGEGNHGGFVGGATSSAKVSGKVGQGLYFDSVNDYIQVPHDASLSLTSQTLCSWIRPRAVGSQIIIDKRGANSETGYNLRIEGSVSPLDVEYILKDRSGINETGDTEETLTRVIDAIVVGSWSHLCASFDDTSNAVAVYVNGNVATTSSSLRDLSNTPTTYPLRIGDWSGYGLGVPGSTNFNGSIDDVRIYNRALSADEIQQLYVQGGGLVIEAGFVCGATTVEDVDGNVYNTVKVGQQCWMKQNMRVGTRINVSTDQTDNATIEKWCYSNSDSNCTSNNPNHPDGGLYQWNEVMQYTTTPGAQGICPTGWHIPTHDEFTTLEQAVCTSGTCATDFPYSTSTTGFRGTNEGTKLKPNGDTGFEWNLAGYGYLSAFADRTLYGTNWSSTQSGANAWIRYPGSATGQIQRSANPKNAGYPVRCLKD